MKPKPEPPKATCPKCGKPVSIGGDGRLVTHGPSSAGKMTCPGSWGTPETGKP